MYYLERDIILKEDNIFKKLGSFMKDGDMHKGVIKKTIPSVNNAEPGEKAFDLKKIGLLLSENREKKGLEIKDISASLCLNKTIVKAIEEGNRSMLPHDVYTRGYIRKYSSLLGIAEVVEAYLEKAQETPSESESDTKIIPNIEKKTTSKVRERKSVLSGGNISKTPIIYAAVVLIIAGYFIFDNVRKDVDATYKLRDAIENSAVTGASDEGKVHSPILDDKKLMITCSERTWISIIIDNNEKKEFMLKSQEVVVLNAKEKFDILVGNAGGVKIFFNGKDIGFSGESGQVKRVTLS